MPDIDPNNLPKDFPPLSLAEMLALDILADVVCRCGGNPAVITNKELVDIIQPYFDKVKKGET